HRVPVSHARACARAQPSPPLLCAYAQRPSPMPTAHRHAPALTTLARSPRASLPLPLLRASSPPTHVLRTPDPTALTSRPPAHLRVSQPQPRPVSPTVPPRTPAHPSILRPRSPRRTRVRGLSAHSCASSADAHLLPFRSLLDSPDSQATSATVVAQFRDYHAETFSGQGDPRIVDEWIQGLEFIFEVMDCPDRYRVVCAQLQLTGDARLWWNAYWSMRPGEKAGCTWDMFKELVREKFYPSYYRAEMERQFLALTQVTRTIDEYEREFTRLAAFVPDLVRTEAQRAQRFIDGLYPAVRHNIVGHGTQTYARA
ncbi:Unknown protein, partial [Striga hermonthica]